MCTDLETWNHVFIYKKKYIKQPGKPTDEKIFLIELLLSMNV